MGERIPSIVQSLPMQTSLLDLLQQHQPWDDREAQHQANILTLLTTTPSPFHRQHYQPGHITGSAWVVSADTQQVALIYHRKFDRWLQPGGHAEPGEIDGRTTAIREVREEAGLTLRPSQATLFDLDVHLIPEMDCWRSQRQA